MTQQAAIPSLWGEDIARPLAALLPVMLGKNMPAYSWPVLLVRRTYGSDPLLKYTKTAHKKWTVFVWLRGEDSNLRPKR